MPFILQEPCEFVTPLLEITYMIDPLPFSMSASLERVIGWRVYNQPPLFSHGSEKRYIYTHRYALNYRCRYKLSAVTNDPIGSIDVGQQLILRYQLNPYRPPYLPPPRGFEDDIFRNQRPYLREVFMEAVPLLPSDCSTESLSAAASHTMCGVNVYTKAKGVFSCFPCGGRDGLVLIYSTVPSLKKALQRRFDASLKSLSLIVDDVFVDWDSLGMVSLNELHEMGALYIEGMGRDVFDMQLRVRRARHRLC
ncbi:hypothetical protein DQ04_12541030 [Trypanosoma grayi]|uniref:hypothetical protein n=1 Tax=Trypanosoma grayi TaxID=71804 RepID=UPI0004F4ADB3|nr:hypothetical protein DQ04_12541030 [Trypanosoma grayi]KEG06730.1 hypothetical protein DQ04_12541030 [Trypanosoma grayi]